MPSPTSPWNALLSQAAVVDGATPVSATAANSLVASFGNWSFGGNLDILALDDTTPPSPGSLAIDATVPVMLFAAGTGGVVPWTNLSSITINGSSPYVVLSGAETQVANGGGGLLQAGATGLAQINNTTSANSFYDLSGLDFATVTALALQGGNGTGVGEIAVSNAVLTSALIPLAPATWSGIQVLDAVGDTPGGVIDLAHFGPLSELTTSYVLRTSSAAPQTVAAGNAVVQFLNSFGSPTGPSPALGEALGVIDGPQHLAVNLQPVTDSGKSLNFSLSDLVVPAGSTLAVFLPGTLEAPVVSSTGYFTNTFVLPTQAAAATRNALFVGTEFFKAFSSAPPGALSTVTFQDDVAGTTIATASDLYLGRTTSDRSQRFSSPTEAVGHDSVQFRGGIAVLNADGAGMAFLGTSNLATIDGAGSGGIVMDVGGSHTGSVHAVSGIAVTGSQTYQNLLQGSSGQIESPRLGTGAWDATTVYTSTAKFGSVGNTLMGIGNDVLTGGQGTPQPGSDSTGGDNFFGMGGRDEIALDATPGRHASTIWMGFYAVGHADNGASAARTGSAAVLNTYGQAITAIDGNGNEVYANGYGLPSGYWDFTPPAGFGAEGWTTSVTNFQAGAGGDRLNFSPADWITGTTFQGTALGLVNGSLEAVAPGAATAQRVSVLLRQVAANTTLVLDTVSTYGSAADLAAGLSSLGGYLALSPTHDFRIGSTFHLLVAYATSLGAGSLRVADVWIQNQSIADPSAGIRTDTGMSVQAYDLVHLDGLAGSDLDQLGSNVFFPIAKSSGTSGSDTLTGNATDQLLDAGDGDDTVIPGSGHETIVLGSGADTVRSTLSNLMGDTFRDFTGADRIVVTGVALTRGELGSSDGGLGYDLSHGGSTGSIHFRNGLPGGDLMVAHVGSDTIITYVNYLPALDEGSHVSGSAINGIVNRSYLNGDTSSSFSVRVEAAGGAAFHNTLGTYQVDAGGAISDVRILVGDVKSAPGLLSVGGLAAGSQLGFFLVQDGAHLLPAAALNGGNLSFVPSGGALLLALDGAPVAGVNTFFTHDASKNIDGLEHVLSGVAPDGSGALRIGFEDLLRSGQSDDDFQDVVVTVTATGWHV